MIPFSLEEIIKSPPAGKFVFEKPPHGLAPQELAQKVSSGAARVRISADQSGLSLARSFVFYAACSDDWIIQDEVRDALGLMPEQVSSERKVMADESRSGVRHVAPDDLVD